MKYLLTFLFFFCALFASATDNYLVATVDDCDVTYLIDSPKDFESTNHSTSTTVGDYSFTSNSETVTVARANVKSVTLEIPLTRTIKENETYFCAYLFFNCTNLTEANITFGNSDECTSVGDYFCASMFRGCSKLVSLPDVFNLPQGITRAENYFCYSMFEECSKLASLPDDFNLPQGITSVGNYFCDYMFYGCSSLVSLPDSFNLPQDITSVRTYFCAYMFYGCTGLVYLPDTFNIPQGITESVGNYFCYYMFNGCSGLAILPDTFNLPQEITSVGDDFCNNMFNGCSSLASLPDEFNLPQEITSVGVNFCQDMFYNCSGLVSLPGSFNLPQDITSVGNYFCYYMFYGCSGLESLPGSFNLPQKITSVGDHFCDRMFHGCSGLVSLPDSFNLPQDITSVGTYFCASMFYGCSGLVSLPDSFNLPQDITSVGNYFCYYMFYGCSSLVSLPDDFNLPQNIGTTSASYFCNSMFYNCSKLAEGTTVELTFPFDATNAFYGTSFAETTKTTTATAKTTYKLKGNSDFYKIRYYDQDGNLIKTQHIEKPEEGSVTIINEFAVDGTTLVDNDNYAFRGWCYESGEKASEKDVVSEDINLYAYISKIEKPDGNSEYTYDLTDENFDYDDHECISINENGDITITVGKDAYIIIGTTENTDLTLKDAEGNTLELETDDEGNLVFHYEGDDQAAFTITAEDGSVSKIILKNVADYYKVSYYYNDELLTIQYIEPVEGATIGEFAVTADDLTIAEGYAFRYWVDADGARVYETDEISEDISLYAYISKIEKANGNSEYTYDLTDENFDYDDHDCINITEEGDITITVGKDAYIIIGTTRNTDLTLKDAEGNTLDLETDDEGNLVYHYEGDDQADFTITATDGSVSKITIQNVANYYRHITYYDQYNEIIGTQKIEVDTQITNFAITTDDLTIEEGYAFRYWTYEDGRRAKEEDVVSEDINLYAYISKIEKPDGNSEYTYDLTDENFDYDDHDCINITEEGDITITVGKDAYIIIGTTRNTDLTLKDSDGNTLELETDDEGNLVYHYEGEDQAYFTITAEDGSVGKIILKNVADYYKVSYYYNDELLTVQYIEPVEGATIGTFAVTANDLNLKDNQTLTGWRDANGNEVTVNTVITADIALYPMIYSPTSIFSTSNDAELISTEYYDLAGRKLAEPQHGVNIVVEYYSDGEQKTTKLLQK